MRQEPHPISGFIYSEVGEGLGLVRVEDRENGREGLFKWDGTYIEGDLTYADPHLLTYIGGPTVPPEHDVYWPMLPLDHDGSKPALPTPELVQQAQAAAAQMPRVVAKYVPDPGKETPDGMRSVSDIDQDWLLENDRHPELIHDHRRLEADPDDRFRQRGLLGAHRAYADVQHQQRDTPDDETDGRANHGCLPSLVRESSTSV